MSDELTYGHPPPGWLCCATCDEWYDPNGDRARMHLHPEPQSGPARDRWLASKLPYEEWIKKTHWGRLWTLDKDKRRT